MQDSLFSQKSGSLDVINFVEGFHIDLQKGVIPFHSEYKEKYDEVVRITKKKVKRFNFEIQEVQSRDIFLVARQKAIDAWKKNTNTPLFVEDTSLSIIALDNMPGTYSSDLLRTFDQKNLFCKLVDKKKDSRALARTLLAIYDGTQTYLWEGVTSGRISEKPLGTNGFGWDDIFIPDDQKIINTKTFAQMSASEKDFFSMRKKAWELMFTDPPDIKYPIFKVPEPFDEELQRIKIGSLSKEAKDFAFKLESIEPVNSYSERLIATKYKPLSFSKNNFFLSFSVNKESPSIGMILTNIEKGRVARRSEDEPMIWEIGPERRKLAFAQRALFFDENQNYRVHEVLENIEKGKLKIPHRRNFRSPTIEHALGLVETSFHHAKTPAISELGYKKISTNKVISRSEIIKFGIFNKIGKFPRKIVGLGAMPPVSGWRDTLLTCAIGHMVSFIPRSGVFVNDIERRLKLGREVATKIESLKIPRTWAKRIKKNLGASLGIQDPKKEVKIAKKLYKGAGIKLFRLYTIASDSRVVETAYNLRQAFGSDIEIFVGQISDKKQAEKLVSTNISADALIYGHGGGQQCTSAINGMAITTLEDIYEITLDPRFNDTSLIVEGGIGRSIGTALIIGIDAVLGSQKLVRGTIETGGIFVQDKSGKFCQPYPGTASPVTQIIESQFAGSSKDPIDAAGRTFNSEGKPGFMYYEAKANSMTFWIKEYESHAARTLADLGVKSVYQLRKFLLKDKREFLRIMSEKIQYLSEAHWNFTIFN